MRDRLSAGQILRLFLPTANYISGVQVVNRHLAHDKTGQGGESPVGNEDRRDSGRVVEDGRKRIAGLADADTVSKVLGSYTLDAADRQGPSFDGRIRTLSIRLSFCGCASFIRESPRRLQDLPRAVMDRPGREAGPERVD